jgi:ABC-type bacteriocin/lantibiotic exporter with double-glycine peptidase domain
MVVSKRVRASIILFLALISPAILILCEGIFPRKAFVLSHIITSGGYLGQDSVILQRAKNDCGPASLKMILDRYGIPSTLHELAALSGTNERGTSLLGLKNAAQQKGLQVEAWRLSLRDLKEIHLPALLFVDGNHYVVLQQITSNDEFIILDPAIGILTYSAADLKLSWSGEALVFSESTSRMRKRGSGEGGS